MDIDSIVISFDKIEETLKGFSITYVERGDGQIIQSYTCTHGDILEGTYTALKEIKPSPQTYISQITMV